MPNYVREVGNMTRVTVSGVGTIGAGTGVALLGIFVAGVATGQIVQLWNGTAAAVTGQIVVGTCTLAGNSGYAIPGVFPGGLAYCVTNEDIDLTIFWNPLG